MSRPRTVSDARILGALHDTISEEGPDRWTLRSVAQRVGLTAPALLQRFGSKRGLLAAFLRSTAERTRESFETKDDDRDPLARLEAGLLAGLEHYAEPKALAHHAALRQVAAADPELRPLVLRGVERRRKAIRGLLDEAVRQGRIRRSTRTGALARAVEITFEGALTTWPLHQRRSLRRWVRRELRRTLAPSLRRRPRT